jgi:L-threonylcarbamoyladenylate synthase
MSLVEAVSILKQGGVIAYPTESVYGLGCDPSNETALLKLLTIKRRSPDKGLILIADCFEKLEPWLLPVAFEKLQRALDTWPGPYTWVFPANLSHISPLLCGKHSTLAVRVTAHPIASALCQAFDAPLVSTSANREGDSPLRDAEAVKAYFSNELDYMVPGPTSGLENPTEIREVLTGQVLRTS